MSKRFITYLSAIGILILSLVILVVYKERKVEGVYERPNVIRDVRYGEDSNQTYDFYTIPDSSDIVLIVLHGGAWTIGDKTDFANVAEYFNNHDIPVANMNYRLAPKFKFDDPIKDLASVVADIEKRSMEYNLSKDYKIAIYGHSAGGHIAAYYCLNEAKYDQKDTALCLTSATPYDFTKLYDLSDKRIVDETLSAFLGQTNPTDASPLYSITPNEKTAFSLSKGSLDLMVPDNQHESFEQALKSEGLIVDTYIVQGAHHFSIHSDEKLNGPYGEYLLEQIGKY